MKLSILAKSISVAVAAGFVLASCGTSKAPDMNSKIDSYLQKKYGPDFRGGRGGKFGSGGMFGSGSRSGSGAWGSGFRGGMGAILEKMDAEDKKLFEDMRDARRSGDIEKSDAIRKQLQEKYPDLFPSFGSGGMRPEGGKFGSGSGFFGSGNVSVGATSSGASASGTLSGSGVKK